ncbi:MAG: SRPBCC family protein [Bacteroidota bacterium]|nr:SRPBCC family protein [Bacteroidota bacterium]MDP4216174.1 SRPBCC family protein [Bacteroidota bacterium]MDP4247052.1 SRPBCC family protein [Bacteroidota bacterium]MDP4255102.1 SRPBCC family protein [Bacteroidota bacterium]MDP4258334.1 SRPBCC family protein [Bacteroidota bacterium]
MAKKITVTALVDADNGKVWDYYTRPEHIINWNFADPSWHCPSATNDLRPGGKYSARMEARDGSVGFDLEMIYAEVVSGKRLGSAMADGRHVVVVFHPRGNKTEVEVSFDPETENPVEMQKMGWQAILDNFKRYVEAN